MNAEKYGVYDDGKNMYFIVRNYYHYMTLMIINVK